MSIANFPNDIQDPKDKAKPITGSKVAKAIISDGYKSNIYNNRLSRIRENRLFASNNQSVDFYKPLLNSAIDTKGDSSYLSIDWSISTPCKKFVDILVGDMLNQDYKISFNAISPHAKSKRENDRNNFIAKMQLQKDLAAIEEQSGLVLLDRSGFTPKDIEELDLYMDMDYRQPIEIGMEEIVDFELYKNDWSKKTQKRITHDLVENSEGIARVYFDENKKIRIRYTDIENYISSYSKEPDNSDVDYEGEITYLTIKDLKLRDTKSEIKEEEWISLAEKNGSKYGNPSFYNESYYNDESIYNDFRVPVLDFVWYTIDQSYWEESINEDKGRTYFNKKDWGYKNKKANIIIKERQVSYEGLYILDIEKVLQYGLSKNMVRMKNPNNVEQNSPNLVRRYVRFKLDGKSVVEVMKPNINNIQILVLRKRHFISEMNPSGVAIDISGIKEVMALMNLKDPLQVIQMYKQKGIGLYSKVDVNGDPTNGFPIQELGSNFSNQLIAFDQSILSEINIIRENIGINDARDGSSQNKDSLVGIEKLKILASNNVTRELYSSFTQGILSQVGKVIAKMVQYKYIYGDGIDEYEDVIGRLGIKSLEFANDASMDDLGIKIEALPKGEDISDLLNMLSMAVQQGTIKPEDYFEIKNILNTKKAVRYLVQKQKKYAEEKMVEFQQREQITAERESASAMASAEAEKIKQQAKAESLISIETAKARLERELDDHKNGNKLKLIDREEHWNIKQIETIEKMKKEDSSSSDSSPTSLGSRVRVGQDPIRTATRTDTLTN